MNKDVVILTEDYPPEVGGVAQWAYGIAGGFHGIGCRVRVYCRSHPDYQPVSSPFEVFPVNYHKRIWKHARTLVWRQQIARDIKAHGKPDVIIATKWNAARGVTGIAGKLGIPLFTVIHGLDVTRRMPALKKRWLINTLNQSRKVVSVSAYTADFMMNTPGIDAEIIVVLPNGVDPEVFSFVADTDFLRERYRLQGKRIILSLSRIIERKGHDMVIRALPNVLKEAPDAVYLIVGSGKQEELARLKKIAADAGVTDRVIFTGRVPAEELPAFYSLCDAYAMPSRELDDGDVEGFGITYLEANACGKAVIGGRSGGVPDAIADGHTGYLVDPNDPQAIAEKIAYLLLHPEIAAELGANGRARVEDRYNWKSISAQMVALCAD